MHASSSAHACVPDLFRLVNNKIPTMTKGSADCTEELVRDYQVIFYFNWKPENVATK